VGRGNTFEFSGFLPGERNAQLGTLVNFQRINVSSRKQDFSGRRKVALAAHYEISQSAFAAPVGAEQDMDLILTDIKAKVVQDLSRANLKAKILYFQQCHVSEFVTV
jgi:hypothetical protein